MCIGGRICANRFLIESPGMLRIFTGRSMTEHWMFSRSPVQAVQKDQVTHCFWILRRVYPTPERAGGPSKKSNLARAIAMLNLTHYSRDIAHNLISAT